MSRNGEGLKKPRTLLRLILRLLASGALCDITTNIILNLRPIEILAEMMEGLGHSCMTAEGRRMELLQ